MASKKLREVLDDQLCSVIPHRYASHEVNPENDPRDTSGWEWKQARMAFHEWLGLHRMAEQIDAAYDCAEGKKARVAKVYLNPEVFESLCREEGLTPDTPWLCRPRIYLDNAIVYEVPETKQRFDTRIVVKGRETVAFNLLPNSSEQTRCTRAIMPSGIRSPSKQESPAYTT